MKKTTLLIGAVVISAAVGFYVGRIDDGPSDTGNSESADREIIYWVAPMDPDYRRDEPGKSPMGMDLVPVYADDVDMQPGVVKIDPTIVNNLGVRTVEAQSGQLPRRIETVGYVGFDEDTMLHIHTRVDGWIENLAVKTTGAEVKKGQLLFELYSPTLVNAQEEYLTALRSGNEPLVEASEERLAALGVGSPEINRLKDAKSAHRLVRYYADADGVVDRLGAREGVYVTPATDIMSIAKLDRIWVLAEVFERQAGWVKDGQRAVVQLDYQPGRVFEGVVDYVYPELDPRTRTLTVRIRFDNEDESLRPNMFARVEIEAVGVGDVVHVPREAVIRGGSVDRVVVALGNGRFRSRPVTLGIESGDRIAIRRGIEAGEEIVISGQFLIDSESNIEAAMRRMEPRQ